MLKFKTSCAVLAYLSSNLLNEVGLSLFRYFEVGLRVCDIVVKKFTFAISSPDEFLLHIIAEYTYHARFCNHNAEREIDDFPRNFASLPSLIYIFQKPFCICEHISSYYISKYPLNDKNRLHCTSWLTVSQCRRRPTYPPKGANITHRSVITMLEIT